MPQETPQETSLYGQWKELIENQTDATFKAFWTRYCDAEARIYGAILSAPAAVIKGSFGELAGRYSADAVLFMGFLDGVSGSLRNTLELEPLTEESPVELDIDIEKLYFNMRGAKAEHLYGLPEWDAVLPLERRAEIAREQRKAGTLVKDKLPGRNDPCPCGSGKKYKKCCGAA
ncbi:MAG: SEC-C domain-containing protein [Clostridiales Family XIII bacterium]|nr:SEC-C domain-containing protein [Clostridiales Family XIII bacterium]